MAGEITVTETVVQVDTSTSPVVLTVTNTPVQVTTTNQGAQGATGASGIVTSPTAPTDHTIAWLDTSSTAVVAATKVAGIVNVDDFGTVGDGTTNDTAAFTSAIASLGSRGGTVLCGAKTYRVENLSIPSNIRIQGVKGAGRANTGTVLKRTNNVPIITAYGTTVTDQIKMCEFYNLRFEGADLSQPIIDISAATGFRWWRCFFTAVNGSWIKMVELFDSRFLDCDFEYGGTSDGATYGLELWGATGFEPTNQIHFLQCRFETYRGTALGTKGTNANEIYFQSCKFESLISTVPHLIFNSAASIGFVNAQVTCGGTGSISSLVQFQDASTVFGSLLLERAGSGTIDVVAYASVATSQNVKIDVMVYPGSPTPSGGYLVAWDGVNPDTISINSTSNVGGVPITPPTNPLLFTRQNYIRQLGGTTGSGSDLEVSFVQQRGDRSDSWSLGRIVQDGSGSQWKMLHNSSRVFYIQNDNKFRFDYANSQSTQVATSSSGTLTLDMTKYNNFFITLTANVTSMVWNFASTGQEVTVALIQDSTGGRTYAFPANCKFTSSAPTNTTASTTTLLKFIYNGSSFIETSRIVGV